MENVTSLLVMKALDGLTARQLATAQNIANANSPGYRPLKVSFEESLRQAARFGPRGVAAVKPRFERAPLAAAGGEMRLDLEIATASQTAMRYSALLNILASRGALMRAVVGGGR